MKDQETSERTSAFAGALAKFQGSLRPLKPTHEAEIPTKKGGTIRYTYAEMADVIEHARDGLAENGLSYTQSCCYLDGHLVVRMRLMHIGGEDDVGYMPVEHSGGDMRALGSAVSYAKRYLAVSMLAMAVGGEDDDGQRAERARQARRESDWSRQARGKAQATEEIAGCTTVQELHDWWKENETGISELNPDTVSEIKVLVSQRNKALENGPQPKAKAASTSAAKPPAAAAPKEEKPKAAPAAPAKEAPPKEDEFEGMFQ